MKTALVLLLSLHLGSCCPKPDYMEKKSVPEYSCLDEDGDFETRLYSTSFWIRTRIHSADIRGLSAANNELHNFVEAFRKKDGNPFDKAWPVLINHTRDNQPWMSWFVPLEFANSSLALLMSEVESDSAVELLHLPESIFHIRKFTGYPSLAAARENKEKLVFWLNRPCPDLDVLEYSWATYDPPYSPKPHNEVWIEDSICSPSV